MCHTEFIFTMVDPKLLAPGKHAGAAISSLYKVTVNANN